MMMMLTMLILLIRHKSTRGFAYIVYDNSIDAINAKKQLQNYTLYNLKINIELSKTNLNKIKQN
jgi:hypothetical protein